ncbi:hypothetical protein Tco_1273875 [Tanacetum coccineum]
MSTQATHNPQQIVNMHNNFMQLVEKIVPTMLGTRKIFTMESRFLRSTTYISRHNIEMTPENKENFQSEKEANFLLFQPGDIVERTRCKDQSFLRNLGSLTDPRWRIHGSLLLTVLQLMNVLTRNYLQLQQCNVNVQFSSTTSTRMFQLEVNEIRAERISQKCKSVSTSLRLLNPIKDNYYQAPKPQDQNATSSSTKIQMHLPDKRQGGLPTNNTLNLTQGSLEIKGRWDSCWGLGKNSTAGPDEDDDVQLSLNKVFPSSLSKLIGYQDTDEEIDEQELEAHYSYMAKIQEVSPEESSSTGQPLEQADQNAVECVNERDALANLIANLTLDTEENKTILKQLKKANASLTLLFICIRKNQTEGGLRVQAFNESGTIDYEILQTKLNETLGLIALKDIEIKEGLKTKAYEISVLDQKHDDLVKKSLLTKSQLEGYLKENTKVISDLKVKEEKDIDKMIEMDKQLKFLNEIVYTRNQSIQTIHMLAPKCATYNGRLTFANPRYLKKAQSDKPYLYEILYDTSDPANRFAPDKEETMTLDN